MTDNDKRPIEEIPDDAVIQALKCCTSPEYNCHHCPFKGVGIISDSCITAMSRAALDLICRKQEEGEWEKVMHHRECSKCHYRAPYKKIKNGYFLQDLTRYCPNCGSKMKGV